MTAKPKMPTKKEPKIFAQVHPEHQIHTTRDYDKFRRLPGNRAVRHPHVQDIKNKIIEHDLRVPILVNKMFEIIDGQHTLEARRELKLDVPYRIGEKLTLHDVQTLNSTSLAWTNDDYAASFVELGNSHYKKYMAFRKKYQFPHDVALILLSGRDNTGLRKQFREGGFRVADLADAETKAVMITQLKEYTRGFRQDVFVKALVIALQRVGFSFPKFIEKAKEHRLMFQYWPKVDQNLSMIEDIFNKGSIRKVPIRYGRKVKEPNAEKEPEKSEVTDDTEGNGKAGKPRGAMVKVGGRVLGVSARAK